MGRVVFKGAITFKLRLHKPLISCSLVRKVRLRRVILFDVLWFIACKGHYDVEESALTPIEITNLADDTVTLTKVRTYLAVVRFSMD